MRDKLSTGIFLLQKDKSLIEMNQAEYVTEDVFQELLEKYPNLLAGDQIDELEPRKWLLVSREVSIPDKEESGRRWSVDHLFLDQDGIPTLVEVKRSSDTRLRREVVGQLLEYAANAINYWTVDSVRRNYEHHCEKNNISSVQKLKDAFDIEDIDDYWDKVKTNLESGKLRLLFVADEIPFELKTMVEFLNEQMERIEVLAVEIKQYVGGDNKTLVPRVFGQTTRTQIAKTGKRESRQWDEKSFMADLEKNAGKDDQVVAQKLLNWAKERKLIIYWGHGYSNGSFSAFYKMNGIEYYTFYCWTKGGIELQFQYIKTQPPFDDIEKRKQIMNKFNEIPGANLTVEKLDYRPSIKYDLLKSDESFKKFIAVWESFIEEANIFNSK